MRNHFFDPTPVELPKLAATWDNPGFRKLKLCIASYKGVMNKIDQIREDLRRDGDAAQLYAFEKETEVYRVKAEWPLYKGLYAATLADLRTAESMEEKNPDNAEFVRQISGDRLNQAKFLDVSKFLRYLERWSKELTEYEYAEELSVEVLPAAEP